MRTSVKTIIPLALAALILVLNACKKVNPALDKPPVIELKTGGNYTSEDRTVRSGDTLTFGIKGSTNGSPDKLTALVVRISVNDQEFETRRFIEIPESQNTDYDEDISFKLVTTGTQKIRFILTNSRGLDTGKSLTFTVLE